MIFQAIANLLDNAIKYAPQSKIIQLSIATSSGDTLIKVTDQGPGIPEESQRFVTQRFKRLTSKKEVFGHGLGLTLVQAIVSLHHGGFKSSPTRTKDSASASKLRSNEMH